MVKVGINGLGVIGRYLIRALEKEKLEGKLAEREVEIVAFNDLYPTEQLAPLLAHESVYLGFPGKVQVSGKDIIVNGEKLDSSAEKDPAKLHWGERGVDIVYESSGAFTGNPGVEGHLEAGAKKVVYSAPSDFAEKTIVIGVNDDMYKGEDIISGASCTTNCLAPLAFALYKEFGEYTGLITTIHAYTADQRLQDAPHKDPARGFAAALNFAPTSTGAAEAIGNVLPQLDGKLDGRAVRGPVSVGSIVDLVVNLSREVKAEEVNKVLQEAAEGYLKGTLEYREGPIVSTMVLGSPIPSIVDASQTRTIKDLVKVFSWYDNIAGYSHQALKLIQLVGNYKG